MNINNRFIRRCFDLSRLGMGSTSPNPSVGAVIVDARNRIVGEGWTSPFGGPHAEVNAVASVKPEDQHLLTTSTIYVSLEPCFHFGKTPPCVDLILKTKIPHVVIAYKDPFPKVAGKSIQKLKEQGVKTEILALNNNNSKPPSLLPFFKNISKKRPYIILKWAETADGFIGHPEETLPISNVYAKRLVHKWRSEADAIMVGTNTAALDNPELTNRLYYGKSPIRVVLDKNKRLPKDLHIFDNSTKTLIYTEGGELSDRLISNQPITTSVNPITTSVNPITTSVNPITTESSVIYRPVSFDENVLISILQDLYQQNIGILFVEGGAQLLRTFIAKGLWDEARVFKTTKTLMRPDGIVAPSVTAAHVVKEMQIFDNQLLIFRPT